MRQKLVLWNRLDDFPLETTHAWYKNCSGLYVTFAMLSETFLIMHNITESKAVYQKLNILKVKRLKQVKLGACLIDFTLCREISVNEQLPSND